MYIAAMSERYDAIVLGLGAMGAAAAMHLARRGCRVLGLEQFDLPDRRGSSHGFSRMIRLCYYEHPDYVPLLQRSYELWREIESASGQRLMHITGGLYMGPEGCEAVAGSLRTARERGLPHELLSHAAIAHRFPQFHLPGDHVGLFEPSAGFLIPERSVAAHAAAALRSGAELRAHEAALEWHAEERGVRVRTARVEYSGARLVITAGPWAGRVMSGLGVPLTVTRQVMAGVWPRRPELFALGGFPCWALDSPGGSIHYGFPMHDEAPGLKIALHRRGEVTDPDALIRDSLPGDEDTVRPALCRTLPDADGPLLALRACMYTNSLDSHFIIDRHPSAPNTVIACGFSGHGFKFAPVVGEVLADLALDGRTRHPVAFLGLTRFGIDPGRPRR